MFSGYPRNSEKLLHGDEMSHNDRLAYRTIVSCCLIGDSFRFNIPPYYHKLISSSVFTAKKEIFRKSLLGIYKLKVYQGLYQSSGIVHNVKRWNHVKMFHVFIIHQVISYVALLWHVILQSCLTWKS